MRKISKYQLGQLSRYRAQCGPVSVRYEEPDPLPDKDALAALHEQQLEASVWLGYKIARGRGLAMPTTA